MGLTLNFVAVLAALITTHAVQGLHFPRGKTLVYKYYADVKTGTIEPAAYASQFTVEGTLYIKHDTSDATLKNAYYVALRDVKTGMFNGAATFHNRINVANPIGDAAKILEEPFFINYNETGLVQSVKIPSGSGKWHKNMKMAMVSMLQLDFSKIDLETSKNRQNFISKEGTIYGECSVTYDVFPKGQYPTKDFVIMKFFSPSNCTGFYTDSYNNVDINDCSSDKDDLLNVDSKRVIEIGKDGEEIIIKKLYAHGGVNYLPWNRMSKVHYVLTNVTFDLERMAPASEIELPSVEIKDAPVVDDLAYQGRGIDEQPHYPDFTEGRHNFDEYHSIIELQKLLEEAVDYTEENHFNDGVPNWKHGQTVNRIYRTINGMKGVALERVFNSYNDSNNPRDIAMKNVFVGIIPQVGSLSTVYLTAMLIREKKVPEATAIEMVKKLDLKVIYPADRTLTMLTYCLIFDDSMPVAVRKAGVLRFSPFVYRTFKDMPHPEDDSIFKEILEGIFDLLKSISERRENAEEMLSPTWRPFFMLTDERNYEMTVAYLMAIRNIKIGKIYRTLAPIIRGDLAISKNPVNIRLLAIWAVEESIVKDHVAADELLWPIMADTSLPVKLRIAAYEILIHIPNEVLLRRIEWFMIGESNYHLYNYHYTTIRNIVKSKDPCKFTLRRYIKKIISFNNKHENTRDTLSASYAYDDADQLFESVGKIRGGLILNERNGVPEVVRVEGSLVRGPEVVVDMGIRLHIQGLRELFTEKKYEVYQPIPKNLTVTKVLEVLKKAARTIPPETAVHVDIILLRNGRVIQTNHYNRETLTDIYDDYFDFMINHQQTRVNDFYQNIRYDHLSHKQVINDLGLPVLLESNVPVAASMQFNYDPKPTEEPIEVEFECGVDIKLWRHGEYALSTYNPISDAWHSIKRVIAIDTSLPIRATIYSHGIRGHLKISWRPLSGTKLPIAGMRLFIKDLVTIDAEKGYEMLQKTCPTCNVQEDVSIDNFQKFKFNTEFDSALTGLKYNISVLDCELGSQLDMPDLYDTVTPPRGNSWNGWRDEKITTTHQKMENMLLYPQLGNCGVLLKLEPSQQYPTSTINFNLRSKFEGDGNDYPWFYRLKPEKYEIVGSVDVVPGPVNISAMSFGFKANVNLNEGHLLNTAKLELSYMIPGAQIHKICLNAEKSFPPPPLDPLELGLSKQETRTILTVTSGYVDYDNETCPVGSRTLSLTMIGELSEEQKKHLDKGAATGLCAEEMKNPLYGNSNEFVPMTLNCLNEAITYTTLRKYTINMTHRQLPASHLSHVIDYCTENLRSILSPYLKLNFEVIDYANLNIVAEIPMQTYATDDKDDHTKTEPWLSAFRRTDIKNVDDNVAELLWWAPLDNARFSYDFLSDYTEHKIRMCSVQPQITMTTDYKTIPFNVPHEWTLVTGDYKTYHFAIFAKSVGNNLAAKIYVGTHQVEIMPSPENGIQITIDDNKMTFDNKTEMFVRDAYANFRPVTKNLIMTPNNNNIIVQFPQISSLLMAYSPKQIALTLNEFLFMGRVGGLCGHPYYGSHHTNITEFYTLNNN